MAAFYNRSVRRLLRQLRLPYSHLDICHVLSVTVFPQELTRANDNINTIDSGLDGYLDIVHMTSHMREDLGLQSELADGLAVESALLTGARASELDAVNAKGIKLLGDGNLGLGIKVCIGKLLSLS